MAYTPSYIIKYMENMETIEQQKIQSSSSSNIPYSPEEIFSKLKLSYASGRIDERDLQQQGKSISMLVAEGFDHEDSTQATADALIQSLTHLKL